jgi:hypothetical protein
MFAYQSLIELHFMPNPIRHEMLFAFERPLCATSGHSRIARGASEDRRLAPTEDG